MGEIIGIWKTRGHKVIKRQSRTEWLHPTAMKYKASCILSTHVSLRPINFLFAEVSMTGISQGTILSWRKGADWGGRKMQAWFQGQGDLCHPSCLHPQRTYGFLNECKGEWWLPPLHIEFTPLLYSLRICVTRPFSQRVFSHTKSISFYWG